MAGLRVPIIVTVIGEGGSGGALAIAVGDVDADAAVRDLLGDLARRLRVDPVEIAEHAPEAAETLGITATRLKQLGLIDKIVTEPLGGAHRDHAAMMVDAEEGAHRGAAPAAGAAARHAARSARGQDPRLRQVQGDRPAG